MQEVDHRIQAMETTQADQDPVATAGQALLVQVAIAGLQAALGQGRPVIIPDTVAEAVVIPVLAAVQEGPLGDLGVHHHLEEGTN